MPERKVQGGVASARVLRVCRLMVEGWCLRVNSLNRVFLSRNGAAVKVEPRTLQAMLEHGLVREQGGEWSLTERGTALTKRPGSRARYSAVDA